MTASRNNCPEGRPPELLLAYIEGGLEGSARREIEEHVKGCPFCSSQLEQMSRMHTLLKAHPEAFHPGEEELYNLVARGEDGERRVAAHLESCASCRGEADTLRQLLSKETPKSRTEASLPAYLARELDRVYPQRSPRGRRWDSVWVSLREWSATAFRGSMPALGTVAAMLLIAVLAIPMWHAFKEPPHLSEFRRPQRDVGKSEPAAVRPGEEKLRVPLEDGKKDAGAPSVERIVPPVETEKAKEEAPKPAATPGKRLVVPPGFSSADVPAKGRVRAGPIDVLKDRVGENSGGVVPASPVPQHEVSKRDRLSGVREEIREKDEAKQVGRAAPTQGSAQEPLERDKETEGLGRRLGAAPPLLTEPRPGRKLPAEAPGRGETSTNPLIGVTVLIVDSQGRAIPGVRFTPPPELGNLYGFLNGSGEGKPTRGRPTTFAKREQGLAYTEHRDAAGSLVITVRVVESGSLYELKADLMTTGVGGVAKKVEAHDVKKEDLERTIGSLVSSLLLESPKD